MSVRDSHVLSIILAGLILLPGCGGSSSSPAPASQNQALCSQAFTSSAFESGSSTSGTSPSGVGLSTCPLDANRNVVIGTGACGPDVFVDQSFTGATALGTITVNSAGILYFPDNEAMRELDTAGILVNSGGIVRVGTSKCPAGNKAITDQDVINFTGAPPQPSIPKGITVMSGGTLSMYGEKGTPLNMRASDVSWTYLAMPAGPSTPGAKVPVPADGADTIRVGGQLDWKAGDWIVIASTDFDPDAGEFVEIASEPRYDSETKITTISLKQNLVNYHFGGAAPDNSLSDPNCKNGDGVVVQASYCEGAAQNFGVDERAEVGLVTRNIKLTSTQSELPFWQPGATYATGAIIQGQALGASGSPPVVTTYQFKATTGGTSSVNLPPNFPNATGATVDDGSVVWTNMGPIDLHWGGEINIAGGAIVQIEGVEIENFGKDNRGSSPISINGPTTLPSANTADGDIADNTIHHSYNHGIVLGSATGGMPPNGLKITGNVIARAVGHLYDLADGTATNIAFSNNLGAGAMEYGFGTCNPSNNYNGACAGLTAAQFAARQMFWLGDNLAAVSHYDGYNIPLTDLTTPPKAQAPVSGFYITNISASLTGNSIAGCQGNGNGVLYLPAIPVQTGPVATFMNNRVHGCYVGLDASYGLSPGYSGNQNNIQPKDSSNLDQLTTFDGLTATRNRYFGTWMRPNYFVVTNSRFATNRESISLVSGGGPESSPAGEWGLMANSVVIGESQNNPNRFGPCPITPTQTPPGPWGNDGLHGCNGDDFAGRGYPQPYWNEYGYMFYDGPARLDSDRFVNFLQDIASIGTTAAAIKINCATPISAFPGLLTNADATFLCKYSASATIPGNNASNSTGKPSPADSGFVYEGDAAFGWFQSNVNNYPPTQYSEHMIFENVDLRHQVYTQEVNQGPFVDGDKGTVILDRDGSLNGYYVVTSTGTKITGKYPISLNNLPFLGTPNSVDECHASGPQDEVFEGRATALMSPQDYATLEVNALTPPAATVNCPASGKPNDPTCPCISWAGSPPTQIGNYNAANCNQFHFTKDQKDYPGVQQYDVDNLGQATLSNPFNPSGLELISCAPDHSCISLAGRNQTGSYEPKVINGLGYTMQSLKGFPSFMDLGLVDATAANGISSAHPFGVRLGVCYKTQNGTSPASASDFTVKLGRKSWSNTGGNLPLVAPFLYMQIPTCQGIDFSSPQNILNCPAAPANGTVVTLTGINVTSGSPLPGTLDPNSFYYDATNGLLFLSVQQTEENGIGSSPLGTPGCNGNTNDPCPDPSDGESFYSCPADGCGLYTIMADNTYSPSGPTVCTPYGGPTDYSLPYPSNMNQLAYLTGGHAGMPVQSFITPMNGMSFDTIFSNPATQQFPHNLDGNENGDCTFK